MWGKPTLLRQGYSNYVLDTRVTAVFSNNGCYFRLPPTSLPQASTPVVFPARKFCLQRKPIPKFSPTDGGSDAADEISDASFARHRDSTRKDHKKESNSTSEILKRLKKYGMSGILSYGLLNTAYYLPTFLFVWFYVAPAPGRMGYVAAVERFLKTFAMVWAGSQVTKLARVGGALALAPVVDRGLSWFTVKFNFESQGKAFMAIVGFCFGMAFLVFLLLTLLWA